MVIEPPRGDLLVPEVSLSVLFWLVGGVCYLIALARLLRTRFTGAPVPWRSLTKLYLIAAAGYVGGTLVWLPTRDSELVMVLIPLFVLPACLQLVLVRRYARDGTRNSSPVPDQPPEGE